MRRFTLLAVLLTVFMSAFADEFLTSIAPGNKYGFITCSNNVAGYIMYDDGEGAIRVGNPDNYSFSDPNCQFEFEAAESDGWYYLKNVGTGNYFLHRGKPSGASQPGDNLPLGPDKVVADTTYNETEPGWAYTVTAGDPAADLALDNWYVLKGAGAYPTWLYAADDDMIHGGTPEAFAREYLFRFVQNGESVAMQNYFGQFLALTGATTDDQDARIPLTATAADAAAFTWETIDAAKGQFRIASNNDEAVKYLHLQGNDAPCYWSGTGAQSQFLVYTAALDSALLEAAVDTVVTYSYAETFQVAIANGDQMWIKNSEGLHVNMYFGYPMNSGVTYWTGSGDASRWHIVLVEEGGNYKEQLKALMDEMNIYLELKDHAGEVGYYSEDAYAVLLETAEQLLIEYDPEYCTDDDAQYYISVINDALSAFKNTGVVFPALDTCYRLRNTVTGEYAAMTDPGIIGLVDGDSIPLTVSIMLPFDEKDPRQVWQLNEGEDNDYYLRNMFTGQLTNNTNPIYGFSDEKGSTWELFNNTGEGKFQIHIHNSYFNNFNLREYWAAEELPEGMARDSVALAAYTYSSWSTTYWVFEACEMPEYNAADWNYAAIGYFWPGAADQHVDTLPILVADEQIYDLFGRRISQPLPGTIYIKGGKKFMLK